MGGVENVASSVRVLIVDSVELFRRGLRQAMEQDGRFAICGEITQVQQLPGTYERLHPDIVLMVIEEQDGESAATLPAAHALLDQDSAARVVLLIPASLCDRVVDLIQAGALGILLRDAAAQTVLGALEDVLSGGSVLDPRLARRLFDELASPERMEAAGPASALDPRVLALLSAREREVLAALAQGYRNKRIGEELGVSVGTVKTHLRHIFRKLRVTDRTAAVLAALESRLRKAA